MSKDLRQIYARLAASTQRIACYALIAIAGTSMLVNMPLRADDYPSRPVQLIIPFAAAGPTDIVGRIMAAKMGQLLGTRNVMS